MYKITSTDGGYNMTDFENVPKSKTSKDTILAYNISIDKDATHTYTVEYKYLESTEVDQSADMGKTLTGKIFITKGTEKSTLANQLLNDNPTISTRTDFSTPFTTNTANTLYKATENGTDVYYFAGQDTESTPINNWVKFGTFDTGKCMYNNTEVFYIDATDDTDPYFPQSESQCLASKVCSSSTGDLYFVGEPVTEDFCKEAEGIWLDESANWTVKKTDFYWRVIRTNSDGSIRLLYSGTSPDTTEGYIDRYSFNTTIGSKYVGYMYGNTDTTLEEARTNTNDSTIKTYIDNWYENNLTPYTNYLSNDAVYCNDRDLASGKTYSTSSDFDFNPYERLSIYKTPTYDCTNNKDAFSVNNTEAKLKYPIALMTADEIAYAGGVDNPRQLIIPMWYYTNSTYDSITGSIDWWLLSPGAFSSSASYGYYVFRNGQLSKVRVGNLFGVRPVASLKSCVQWKSGNGSATSPYEILENGGC